MTTFVVFVLKRSSFDLPSSVVKTQLESDELLGLMRK